MPNAKISELTSASALDGTELIAVVQDGTTKKSTIQSVVSSGNELGFGRYDDGLYTSASPLSLSDGVTVQLTNNANTSVTAGDFTMYNSGTGKLLAENVNDCYILTVVFKAKAPNANQTHLDISMSGVGDFDRINKVLVFAKGNDVEQNFHQVFQYYADADFVANGVTLNIASHGGSATLYDIIFFVQRTQKYY